MKNKLDRKNGLFYWTIGTILVLYALIIVVFLVWAFLTSFKDKFYFYNVDMIVPAPFKDWAWNNYLIAWEGFAYTMQNGQKTNALTQVYNTIVYALGGAMMHTIATCMVAYIVAKYKYWFCEVVYVFVIFAMVIPIIGSAPATLVLLRSLGLYDNLAGPLVTNFSFVNMHFLIFYAAFKGISNEYTEAATIDGAGELTIFVRVILPLVMPVFSTIVLIQVIAMWNDFQFAFMYMPNHPTLAYSVLYVMKRSPKTDSVPLKFACGMILALPILFVFIIFRNKIMGNVTMGGVKE